MSPARQILVSESEPFWLPALQWEFQVTDVVVSSVEGADGQRDVSKGDVSQRVLVTTLDRITEFMGGRSGGSRVIAIASPQQVVCEWAVRELGAVAVVEDSTSPAVLAALCRRLLS